VLVFGAGGAIFGFLFSFVLNRLMLVAYSQRGDVVVPHSILARFGNKLLGWHGLIALLIIVCTYFIGNLLRPLDENEIVDRSSCAVYRDDIEDFSNIMVHMNSYGLDSALWLAAQHGSRNIVELFLSRGIDIDRIIPIDNRTILHSAARSGHKELVQFLIERGAEINIKDGYGNTVMDLVNQRSSRIDKYFELVTFLRTHGAKTASELKAEGK
jgi:ankyrin repeat protein